MNKAKSLEIVTELQKIIPNPVCELNFKNNFELLCAVMLSAQTTDKRVNSVTKDLFFLYPDSYQMAEADYDKVVSVIKPLGLATTKAKNIIELSKKLNELYQGVVPHTIEELTVLPGVGRKTASVVLAVGFHIPAMPVDTHVLRVSKRLGYVKEDADVSDAEVALKKFIPQNLWIDTHHLFLLFGRYHCKSLNPECENCSLKKYCKHKKS